MGNGTGNCLRLFRDFVLKTDTSKVTGCFDPFDPTGRPATTIFNGRDVPWSAAEAKRNLPEDFKHHAGPC
jgi:hypothetical protein